jgi:hypothetical protein
MTLRLEREPSAHGATIGRLTIDGVFQCFILEDVIREEPMRPVSAWKVYGETAIPAGRYRIVITHSPAFKRALPLLLDVPGFAGVRVHAGNRARDSNGCLLPGRTRGRAFVGESVLAFGALFQRIQTAIARGEDAWIEIVNPPPAGQVA